APAVRARLVGPGWRRPSEAEHQEAGSDGEERRWKVGEPWHLQGSVGLHAGAQEVVARPDPRHDAAALAAHGPDAGIGGGAVHLRPVLAGTEPRGSARLPSARCGPRVEWSGRRMTPQDSPGREAAHRVLVVAGARPNFMKVAPILRALHARPDFEAILVHTG